MISLKMDKEVISSSNIVARLDLLVWNNRRILYFDQFAKATHLELTVDKHATASQQTHVLKTLVYAAMGGVLRDGLELIANVSIFSNILFIPDCPWQPFVQAMLYTTSTYTNTQLPLSFSFSFILSSLFKSHCL